MLMFVMPMFPGNTPKAMRRQLYMDLAHGIKAVNWWPVITFESGWNNCAIDYREYAEHPPGAMFVEMRRSMAEVSGFDDIIYSGHRGTHARVALMYSETGDIWGAANVQAMQNTTASLGQRSSFVPPRDCTGTLGSGKRTLFLALRHAELVVDIVIEDDAVAGELGRYSVVFLADPAVSAAATAGLAGYVRNGGTLFATASAGLLTEHNQTNAPMLELLGIEETGRNTGSRGANDTISLGKMDLPWAETLDTVELAGGSSNSSLDVFGLQSAFSLAGQPTPTVLAKFGTGSPAVVRRDVGRGHAVYAGFLPGLSYFHAALPREMPVDRGASDSSGSHFIPHKFATPARDAVLVGMAGLAEDKLARPVRCSEPLVDAGFIAANETGSAVVLSNWSGRERIDDLVVTVDVPGLAFTNVSLASGGRVRVRSGPSGGSAVFVVGHLSVGDAIILR